MVTGRRDDTDLEATGAQDGSVVEVVVVTADRPDRYAGQVGEPRRTFRWPAWARTT